MFEKLKNVTIKGGYFEQASTLELFKDNQLLNIVYGRNGSGKTTIAKAIRQLVGKDAEQSTEEGYVSYTVSTDEIIPEGKKDSVYVFDEDFVRDNVRMKGHGLETIVMMGEQVDLDAQITYKNEEKGAIEKKIDEQTVVKTNFENENDSSSPKYYFNKIKDRLREDGGWADVDRDIKDHQVKSRVTDDLIKRLSSMAEPTQPEDLLKVQLKEDLSLYKKSGDAQTIVWKPLESELPDTLNEIEILLERRIENPTLNEREQRLFSFLQEHAEHNSIKVTKQMVEEKWPFCPLCLRETTDDDYGNISDTLKMILNRESETYSEELDRAMGTFTDISAALPMFPDKLNEAESIEAQLSIEILNKDISSVRSMIARRKKNLYGVVTEAFDVEMQNRYISNLARYRTALKNVGNCVEKFNRSVNEREKLKKKIQQENELLARKQLDTLLGEYKKSTDAYESCKETMLKLLADKERVEDEIKSLKAQMEQTDIAKDYINDELQYVFYSNTKAALVSGDRCYKLKINGRNVPPKKISVGERNVLGLCYFFAKLFSDIRKNDRYKEEILIVIDDPVSSFDYGNRLGVMSLLRYQFNCIKQGNPNSRILLLTHDLRSAFDMVKIRSELNGGRSGGKKDRKFFELVDKQLKGQEVSSEYKKLLGYIFDYARNSSDVEDEYMESSIGNVMRRALEAFSSFCYNMKFEEMMCREGVLKNIPKEKRNYYENFMCRLALNGESHMEEHVYELNTITPYFTKQEKVQTAKSLLLLLKYVNAEHLMCYLASKDDDQENIMAVISSWEEESKDWLK